MAEKPTLPDKLSSWVKLLLLAALPIYLIIDLIIGEIASETRQSKREALCFKAQNVEVERNRRKELPVSVLGKFHHFLSCARIDQVSVFGWDLKNEEQLALSTAVIEQESAKLAQLKELEATIQTIEAAIEPSSGPNDANDIEALPAPPFLEQRVILEEQLL